MTGYILFPFNLSYPEDDIMVNFDEIDGKIERDLDLVGASPGVGELATRQ